LINAAKNQKLIMKGAGFLAIALLLLATMPVLVRCQTTFLNEQITLNNSNVHEETDLRWWTFGPMTKGDTISVTLGVSGNSPIDFDIYVMGWDTPTQFEKKGIGTEGLQKQFTVPEDENYSFSISVASTDPAASVTVTITLSTSASQSPSLIEAKSGGAGSGGGFDPTPIVVIVMVLVAVLISVFLIFRLRRQPPPPPPAEGQPPPP
jgi:hypothetical protein